MCLLVYCCISCHKNRELLKFIVTLVVTKTLQDTFKYQTCDLRLRKSSSSSNEVKKKMHMIKTSACMHWKNVLQLPSKPKPEGSRFILEVRNAELSSSFRK